MARMWANRLEAGTITWAEVLEWRKSAVKKLLLADVKSGRGGMDAETYMKITGEPCPLMEA